MHVSGFIREVEPKSFFSLTRYLVVLLFHFQEILVNTKQQSFIVIGKQGATIKDIQERAIATLEKTLGTIVRLQLSVKIRSKAQWH